MRLWSRVSFAALLTACASSHGAPPRLVECEPRVSPEYLWHTDLPWPRGRMHACEACVRTEDEVLARQRELGCELRGLGDVCTLEGACEYEALALHWEELRASTSCASLEAWRWQDPCRRPDAEPYWREQRD